jgi:putative addiction module component (TIGR02574 family)
MSIDTNELRALPAAEKLRLIGWLWDELGDSTEPIPVPEWVQQEAARRLDEMRDPEFGLSHEEVWERIDRRNG